MNLTDPADLAAAKALMRSHAVGVRRAAAVTATDAGVRLAAMAGLFAPAAGTVIAGYWPIGDEIDSRPLLERFAALGFTLALPMVAGPGRALGFRRWAPGQPLVKGAFGTRHPGEGAPVETPGMFLLPLLAFDRAGFRLGYGGGYYDRTLELARSQGHVTAVGLAFAAQEMAAVPHDRHDQPLDAVATEKGVIGMERA